MGGVPSVPRAAPIVLTGGAKPLGNKVELDLYKTVLFCYTYPIQNNQPKGLTLMDNITNIINWLTALTAEGDLATDMQEQMMDTVTELFEQEGFVEAFDANVQLYIDRVTPIAIVRLADAENEFDWIQQVMGSAFATGMAGGVAATVLAAAEEA